MKQNQFIDQIEVGQQWQHRVFGNITVIKKTDPSDKTPYYFILVEKTDGEQRLGLIPKDGSPHSFEKLL